MYQNFCKGYQYCESAVLIGNEWSKMRYKSIKEGSVTVFKAGFQGVDYVEFAEGKDYEIDYKEGRIRRTKGSSITDYRESKFYQTEKFDHNIYNGNWGNYPFMIYISYIFSENENITVDEEARRIFLSAHAVPLIKTKEKLLKKQPLTYVVFGDSISTGCEALYSEEAYFNRFAKRMRSISGSDIRMINAAKGGETSCGGKERFEQDVLSHKPDLISIAYGVNDMCVFNGKPDVPVKLFRQNLQEMIEKALDLECEVILITSLVPNPGWVFTNPDFGSYAEVCRDLAKEYKISLADVQKLWYSEISFGKKISDLLLNDVNHPTSYGHEIYYKMLVNLL